MNVRKYFQYWTDTVSRKAFILKKLSLSLNQHNRRRVMTSFRHWERVCSSTLRHRGKVEDYIAHNKKGRDNKVLRQKFYHWKSMKQMTEHMEKLAHVKSQSSLRLRSFNKWNDIVKQKAALVKMERNRHNERIRIGTFEKWHTFAKQKVAFKKHRQKQKFFLRWKFEVSLKESLYQEESVIKQANLGLEESIEE